VIATNAAADAIRHILMVVLQGSITDTTITGRAVRSPEGRLKER